ncbi:HAMP domain-containing protein [Oxalobacteraceae bacterium OM1]|nr:HAMP domain-containing protein [Oxalobacteraceae bacterium OM1]
MFNHLSIKFRLVFVVGFLSLMCMTGGVIGLTSLHAANGAMRSNYADRLVPIAELDEIVGLMNANQVALAAALTDASAAAKTADEVEARMREVGRRWDALNAATSGEEEKAIAERFAASRAVFVEKGLKPAVAALRANDLAAAGAAVHGPMSELFKPAQASATELIRLHRGAAKAEFERTQRAYTWVRNSCISGILFGVLVGAAICWWLMRSIAHPLADAVRLARSVAAGDLTQDIQVNSADETGQLLHALKDMNASLVRIVSEVRSGTETIAAASGQIATGNLDLAGRTDQQASALEETASSMEELTSTVRQNADSALQANQLAVSASEVAVKGGEVVAEVVQTMGSINDSAKKIAEITGLIDSIAFQTNILALNAAVEAARAGEQGRGFAVVATEVRQLAQRSGAAAKQIKDLIGDSVEKVERGATLVDEAGRTMADIVESVKRVTDIMGEISTASREQTDGIQQVNIAINQMDHVTQQNAALVEQSASAASSLQRQAETLAHTVGVFKLQALSAPASSVIPFAGRPHKTYPVPLPTDMKRLANAE